MKFLDVSNTGGQPYFLDDFDWEIAGTKESFSALITSFVPVDKVAIMSGCVRTTSAGPTVNISAGYAVLAGEVCFVPAHSFAGGSAVEHWVSQVIYDPAGTVAFNTPGVTHDVYANRILKVIGAITLPIGATEYSTTKTFLQYVYESLPVDSWHLFRTHTEPPSSVIPGTYQLFVKSDLSKFVHLKGTMYFEDISGPPFNELVGTLPVGYRPLENQTFQLSYVSNNTTGDINTCVVVIQTNGEIRIKGGAFSFAFVLDLGQITPFERAS